MIENVNLRVNPAVAADVEALRREAARVLEINATSVNDLRVARRSIDARKRNIQIELTVRCAYGEDKDVGADYTPVEFLPVPDNAPVLIVVGAGPAGLFCALEAIRHGIRPIVLERGKDVDSRRLDLAEISRSKRINPESNYCFGEGGAGAYSDGKLYTRSKKRGNVDEVLALFVQHGASPDILVDAHPHIGSDRLPHVIKKIRNRILECGGEVRFETTVRGLVIEDGVANGVKTDGEEIKADGVVLATGHSAHDVFRSLHASDVPMEAKGIAMGVRLEHPQHLIDCIRYHSEKGRGMYLPAAEYSFVTQSDGRGVYSFCMCPGGVVVPAGCSDGELVVNGMSASARAGRWANSGMVVEIHPGDFPEFSGHGPLEMLELQECLEKRMFHAAGDSIVAPAQRMTDFVNGRESKSLPASSYAPGIQPGDFNRLLPPFISTRLREGFKEFGRKQKGFLSHEAILLGLESRTSSPVRITRDSGTLQSTGVKGLFPAGEGAGYAGGIVSAAIDGMRCADAFSAYVGNTENRSKENRNG